MPLHELLVTNSKGGAMQGTHLMFWIETHQFVDAHHMLHNAHRLFFTAHSEVGRDDWVTMLEDRGMHNDNAKTTATCEENHRLERKILATLQYSDCNYCGTHMMPGQEVNRCNKCDFDLCAQCFHEECQKVKVDAIKDASGLTSMRN